MKVHIPIKREVLFEKHSFEIGKKYLLLSMLDGCEVKLVDRHYGDSIFYVKNDKILFQQDTKNKYFYVRYEDVWSIFESKYNMKFEQIQTFIIDTLDEVVKLHGHTPAGKFLGFDGELDEVVKSQGYTILKDVNKRGYTILKDINKISRKFDEVVKLQGYTSQAYLSAHPVFLDKLVKSF